MPEEKQPNVPEPGPQLEVGSSPEEPSESDSVGGLSVWVLGLILLLGVGLTYGSIQLSNQDPYPEYTRTCEAQREYLQAVYERWVHLGGRHAHPETTHDRAKLSYNLLVKLNSGTYSTGPVGSGSNAVFSEHSGDSFGGPASVRMSIERHLLRPTDWGVQIGDWWHCRLEESPTGLDQWNVVCLLNPVEATEVGLPIFHGKVERPRPVKLKEPPASSNLPGHGGPPAPPDGGHGGGH